MKGQTRLKKAVGKFELVLEVEDGGKLPNVGYYIEVDRGNIASEVMKITSIDMAQVEVERGKEGTEACYHAKGSLVYTYEGGKEIQKAIMDLNDEEQSLVPSEIEGNGSKSLNIYTDDEGNLVVVSSEE